MVKPQTIGGLFLWMVQSLFTSCYDYEDFSLMKKISGPVVKGNFNFGLKVD